LVVDASGLRLLEAQTDADQNPWNAVRTAVVTLDFVKKSERLSSVAAVEWDLVIFDEAHRATPGTDRGRVLQSLWGSQLVHLLVALSPRSDVVAAFDLRPDAVIKRRASELLDWSGTPLFADQYDVEVLTVHVGPEEREFFTALRGLLMAKGSELAQRLTLARASSSLFAIEQSLRRELLHKEGPERATAFEDEEVRDELLDASDSASTDEAQIPADEIRRVLGLLEDIPGDSKLAATLGLLRGRRELAESILIFTEFRDTAAYLSDQVRAAEPSLEVATLTGATPILERHRVVDSIRDHGGLLIATSAACEGFELADAKLCVHYDVPQNPLVMAQRLGRVHRFGRRAGSVRHVLIFDDILRPDFDIESLFSV
jgi:SNF2 family DNA or RNA helicase